MKKVLVGCLVLAVLGFFLVVVVLAGVVAWQVLVPVTPNLPPGTPDPAPGPGDAAAPAIENRGIVYERDNAIWWKQNARADEVRVTRGSFPALSPDGRRVAFYRAERAGGDPVTPGVFMLRDLESGSERELIASDGCVTPPSWSPDGSCIAVAVVGGNNAPMLMIINPPTGEAQQALYLPHAEGVDNIYAPAWFGDGTKLVFHDMTTLFEILPSGSIVKRTPLVSITGDPECVTSADRFLPCPADPDLIAYSRLDDGSPRLQSELNGEPTTTIYLKRLSSGETTRLTPPEMVAFDFDWSPDGLWIAFCGYGEENVREENPFRVLRMDREGRQMTEVARGGGPNW